MKPKKRDMTYNELHRFLANRYNDYQNADIYDHNYNYMEEEFSEEMFDYGIYDDNEKNKKTK